MAAAVPARPWRLLGAALVCACSGAHVPTSTSRMAVPMPEAQVVMVSGELLLDGQAIVPAASKAQRGLYPELRDALAERAAELQTVAASSGEPFRGRVSVSLPPTADSGVLLRVIQSAAAAGFSKPWLQVRSPGGNTYGIGLTVPTSRTRAALSSESAAPDRAAAVQAGFANPVLRMDPDVGVVLQARDEVIDPGGQGLTVRCASLPCRAWPTAEINRLIRRLKLDHPRDRAVMVVPAEEVPLQALVDTIDATRDDAITARGTRTLLPQVLLAAEDAP